MTRCVLPQDVTLYTLSWIPFLQVASWPASKLYPERHPIRLHRRWSRGPCRVAVITLRYVLKLYLLPPLALSSLCLTHTMSKRELRSSSCSRREEAAGGRAARQAAIVARQFHLRPLQVVATVAVHGGMAQGATCVDSVLLLANPGQLLYSSRESLPLTRIVLKNAEPRIPIWNPHGARAGAPGRLCRRE